MGRWNAWEGTVMGGVMMEGVESASVDVDGAIRKWRWRNLKNRIVINA